MNMRKPFIVEFTGTPEAGKTSTIKSLLHLMNNYDISFIKESAEIIPQDIPKDSSDQNLWIICKTLQKILEGIYSNSDLLLIDRGVLDRLFFNYLYISKNKCNQQESEFTQNLITNPQFAPDLLVHFFVEPEVAIMRRGGEGRLVTIEWVTNYNNLFQEFISDSKFDKIPIFTLDTTHMSKEDVIKKTHEAILSSFIKNECN